MQNGRAALPAGLQSGSDDGNGDGVPNLTAYALGYAVDETVPSGVDLLNVEEGADGIFGCSFMCAEIVPSDILCCIEYSTNLLSNWSILASKEGNADWQGILLPDELVETNGMIRCTEQIQTDDATGFTSACCSSCWKRNYNNGTVFCGR